MDAAGGGGHAGLLTRLERIEALSAQLGVPDLGRRVALLRALLLATLSEDETEDQLPAKLSVVGNR